jgi:hypothetical protein
MPKWEMCTINVADPSYLLVSSEVFFSCPN